MEKIMRKLNMIILALLLITLTNCKKDDDTQPITKQDTKVEQPTPRENIGQLISVNNVNINATTACDFTFDLKGETYSFYEYTKGKNVLFNIWGTWCPPCRKEIPDLVEISKEKQAEWLIIGLALEKASTLDAQKKQLANYMNIQNIEYLNIVGQMELVQQVLMNYGGIEGVPTTFYINKDHKIVDKNVGGLPKPAFLQKMEAVENK